MWFIKKLLILAPFFVFSLHGMNYRFNCIERNDNNQFNLVFLPGGPGLGTEYYLPWLNHAEIDNANVWLLDYPGDGSNVVDVDLNYDRWRDGLVPALSSLENVILVAHSFSGMFVLTISELENSISGLVLIGAAPDSSWQLGLHQRIQKYALPNISKEKEIYTNQRNNVNFRNFTIASWQYFMMEKSKEKAMKILSDLPYNHLPYDWADKHFHPTFSVTWIPEKIPTVIIAGEHDVLTPIELFEKDKRFAQPNISIKKVENASHFPWVEKPNEVISLIKEFLNRIK